MPDIDTRQAQAYREQIEAMADAGRAWLDDHPEHTVRVNVHVPRQTLAIATISDAKLYGLITLNQDAEHVLQAMLTVHDDPEQEPTLQMVIQAFDLIRSVTR